MNTNQVDTGALLEELERLRKFRDDIAAAIKFLQPDVGPRYLNDAVMVDAVKAAFAKPVE